MQHVEDDYNAGWSGMRVLIDVEECCRREEAAYQVEIDLANSMGREDIANRLLENLNEELRRLRNVN